MQAASRVGRVFGRLKVVDRYEMSSHTNGDHIYTCVCSCGNTVNVRWKNLARGSKKSCGCLAAEYLAATKAASNKRRAEKDAERKVLREARIANRRANTRRKTSHPLYSTWRAMVRRCYDSTHDTYKFYGGRGVTVCDEWVDNMYKFAEDMGERPIGATLDRIDSNVGYSPANCRWATKLEQYSNVRNTNKPYTITMRGVTQLVTDASHEKGINPETVKQHIRGGMRPEVAFVAAVLRKKAILKGYPRNNDTWNKCLRKAEEWVYNNC